MIGSSLPQELLPPLPASSLPLSRHELDRDYLSRNEPELFERLWADPETRVLPLWKGNALLDGQGGLALLPTASLPEPELRLYLGNLRMLGSKLSDLQAGLFTAALALANWHASHGFSPRTGARTVPELGGWVRRSVEDGGEVFPRTDPAIIVGIIDSNDRILLGSNALWETNRYSLLAGFVEPGESLESAVIREVFEESGIRVVDPVYRGSQPWPFPASLMLGFTAQVDPDVESTLTPDGAEILDLRWFSREELTAALGEISLPGVTSIARAIIEDWYGGPIDDRIEW
jgi:NAD+ diphosphatase